MIRKKERTSSVYTCWMRTMRLPTLGTALRSSAMVGSLFFALLAFSGTAKAQPQGQGEDDEGPYGRGGGSRPSSNWGYMLGFGASVDDGGFSAIPLLGLRYQESITITPIGIEVEASALPWMDINLELQWFEKGRRESDDGDLKGLGNEKDPVLLGTSINFEILFVSLGLSTTTEINDSNSGTQNRISLGSGIPLSQYLFLNVDLSLQYADAERMQTHYGVTKKQETDSTHEQAKRGKGGYAEYTPGGGMESRSAGLGLMYALSKRMRLIGNIDYTVYTERTKNSPILKRDKTESELGVSLLFFYLVSF